MLNLQPNTLDLSVVIPAMNEALNLEQLLPSLRDALEKLGASHEIIVIDASSPDATRQVVEEAGARYINESARGYGAAILRGVREAAGKYIITMDADQSHPARFIKDLWQARDRGEVVIASRYVEGGRADQPISRYYLSRVLNTFFRVGLSVEVRDLSSGFRLYLAVFAAGVLGRTGWLHLPPGLQMLESWWVIGLAGVLAVAVKRIEQDLAEKNRALVEAVESTR